MASRLNVTIACLVGAVLLLPACSSADSVGDDRSPQEKITVWSLENQADRVATATRIANDFTSKTGIDVEIVGVDQPQLAQLVASSALSGDLPDVIGAVNLSHVRELAEHDLANTEAAANVVAALGQDTFDEAALALDRDGDQQLAVPDSAYARVLVYRKDLFDAAGLPAPETYDDLLRAAEALTRDGMYGITLPTDPSDVSPSQTFESLALGNGCQLVTDAGQVTLNSPACRQTWDLYGALAQKYSPKGTQTVDTTRASYFAGQSAMVAWSTYILDELAGLRNDALPTCPQCQNDPTWLAKNSGIVTGVTGPSGGSNSGHGEISSWVITAKQRSAAAEKFVQYMLSDGYLDWLGMAPEGKFPVRHGDAQDAQRFQNGWKELTAGVDTKKPLSEIYPPEVLQALADVPKTISRWAIPQGQGALLGAANTELVIPRTIGALAAGSTDPRRAADEATEQVAALADK